MEHLINAYNFVIQHWLEIGVAIGYIVAAARVIVKLTPTPADDSVLDKIVKALKLVGLHLD